MALLPRTPSFLRSVPAAPESSAPAKVDADALSDQELLLLLRAGRREAATILYDRVRPAVDRALRSILHSRQRDFEDIAQTAFEQIVRGIAADRFDARSSLRTWASAIAAHVAIDALRKRARENQRTDVKADSAEVAASVRAESALEARAELRRVQDILARMKQDQVETLLLHDVLGHPLEEVAHLTASSLSATQSRLRRARIELERRAAARVPGGSR